MWPKLVRWWLAIYRSRAGEWRADLTPMGSVMGDVTGSRNDEAQELSAKVVAALTTVRLG